MKDKGELTLEKLQRAYKAIADANRHECEFEEIGETYTCKHCGRAFLKESMDQIYEAVADA